MKKFKVLLIVISIAIAFASCNYVPWDEIVSLNISPTLIKKTPKVYPGGNADCSTINLPDLVKTTGRNNYITSTDGFEMGWPSGLLVKVDNDKSVSFQIDGKLNLGDGKCYKIGAVIVKGSDASNVYNYTDLGGVTMDKGLVPPNNASGTPSQLSNLTFCFIECQREPLVIAVKSFYWPGPDYQYRAYSWAGSEGSYLFKSEEWCQYLGVVEYPGNSSFALLSDYFRENVGTVSVVEAADGNSLIITVALKQGGILDKTYLYAGDLAGLYGNGNCPAYENWQWKDLNDAQTHTFIVPY